ncbi:uncharacterized protein EV420DRAFT_1745638 [Desarmillaria tabescens]|uniref:Uncharacterized protein n=1 Tax=Armillaria tabescens TaxID=1929756 RepID=A0AA39NCM3_ARMTA|nr:uncharacterized protein EV420DRAFT_1745638 [Desarmillaria tabescens]KAK0463131.1 hypothetical protein EV420DRAFT_1745638 [Desarmillaria tabescens]
MVLTWIISTLAIIQCGTDISHKSCMIDDEPTLIDVYQVSNKFGIMREQWICVSKGFLLVYSITSRKSFEEINAFYAWISQVKLDEDTFPCIILVANKFSTKGTPPPSSTQDSTLMPMRRCRGPQACQYIEMSGKQQINVDKVFNNLVHVIRKYDKAEE